MIDRTFILTLKRDTARLNATQSHLQERGIAAEPFYGLDHQITGLWTRHSYEVDVAGSGYNPGPKPANLHMSHFILWKAIELLGQFETFMILEDDVRFSLEWLAHIEHAMTNMDSDWDILYPGSCCCMGHGEKRISDRLYSVSYALCTHCYIIRRKVLPVLIEKCERVWGKLDIAMALHVLPLVKAYAVLPRVAWQMNTQIPP